MNHYTITPVRGKPDWNTIPWLYMENQQWMPETDIRAGAQICYTEDGIHVHMRAWEKYVRAENHDLLAQVCDDSCMELFFSPDADDPRYFNVELNPNGCMYLGFGTGRHDLIRLIPSDAELLKNKQVNMLGDGWELFYSIPLSLLRLFFPGYTLKPGQKLRANCYKTGEKTVHPHFITWNFVESREPDFHLRGQFGEMVLG